MRKSLILLVIGGALDWLLVEFVRTTPGTAAAIVVSADGLPMASSPGTSHTLADQLSARPGSGSVVPGFRATSVSKICEMTRIDSPSETSAPSSTTGSAAPAKTSVPPPPDAVVSDPLVPVALLSPPPQPAAMRATNATSGRANLYSNPLTLLSFRYDRPHGGRHVSIQEVGRQGNPRVSPPRRSARE